MALYDDVLAVAKTYMGPAAERFLSRQITSHLNTTTQSLAPQHLSELAKWCYISGKLVMDEGKAREFSEKVKALR
jgi:hypothetical protein